MMRPLKLPSLLLATLLLASMLLATGCTASYWRGLLNTSGIDGTVTTKGKIAWKQTEQDDGSVIYEVSKTAPVLSVALIPGSSPVDLQMAKVDYYSPVGDFENGELLFIDGVDTAIMPFLARLQGETPVSLNLGQIITSQLVDATNPDSGSKIPEIDVQANVTFQGRNQFGSTITWQITVPISVEVE